MPLSGIPSIVASDPALALALASPHADTDVVCVEGMRAPVLSALLRSAGGPRVLLAVVATGREADGLSGALRSLMPDAEVVEFPSWETLPHERLSPSPETVGRRISALRALRIRREATGRDADRPFVLVASVRAALQPVLPGLDVIEPRRLAPGERGHDLTALARDLVDLAYARVDMVTRRGEFAVRGGILDVFPPQAEHPVRLEFFGDELETAREFAVADQRSLPDELEVVELPPARELLLTDAVKARARELAGEFPNLDHMLVKLADGIPVEGMESLAPILVDGFTSLPALLPGDGAVAVCAPERVATRAVNLVETNREFLEAAWNAATVGAAAPVDLGADLHRRFGSGEFITVEALHRAAGGRAWWTLDEFSAADPISGEEAAVRVDAVAVPSFAGRVDGALHHVADRLRAGWAVVVVAEGHGLLDRAADLLAGESLAARHADDVPAEPEPGVALLVPGVVEAGVELRGRKVAVLAEAEFFGRAVAYRGAPRKLASRRKGVVDPLQLTAGDFVVHETHGIGRFVELVEREVSSGGRNAVKSTREFLVIEYAPSKRGLPGDKLFVPTDQLDLLSRYVGGEAPALSKMGGSDWAAAKGKARKAVRDIAVELVKLYGARMASRGHAFAPDTPWQRELEDAFPFAETPDQLTTIDEVKADMERAIPMDRLLSGDVGFGKTEVAVRAAFKAIQDGKQVAMVVPTTLLVRQHLETFVERFAGFPVHVRPLSRFQTEKESAETIAGLKDGSVDMVIGTHRVLGKGIEFKDLGLVIIDEEQRFGVEHKDALKKLKTNVDVLAMTATPIPRTLEMAVTGIREMSTLATPPEDRHPILSFVGPYSDKQVAAAIRREILREGQVFYVHNRVSSIQRVASTIADLVPEARVAVAHGQMGEEALERVMVDFWERRADVLVATTIIETGLDIPNANTLIIDRADAYGLSQLHQLRGRVGRGRERAYAYFLYDETKPLTESGHERLATIAANNELGSGMQIALKDLELRGAGNLLGGEQSGHIAGVGFDLYLRMIGEAVSQFRGDAAEGQTELRLELPVDARIPEDYIASERLRLEAYRKLSTAAAPASPDEAIDQVVEELDDRYGELPPPVVALIAVSRLRRRAQQLGLGEVVVMGDKLRIAPIELPDSAQIRLQRLYRGSRYIAAQRVVLVPLPGAEARSAGQTLTLPPDAELTAWVGQLLTALAPPAAAPEPAAG